MCWPPSFSSSVSLLVHQVKTYKVPCFRRADIHLMFSASSAQRPLKRIHHPTTLAIEIYPRTHSHSSSHYARDILPDSTILHHTDSFRLTLSAFGESFHLHLPPTDHLVHPSARIVYYDTAPSRHRLRSHTQPLRPSPIQAYWRA